MYHVLLCLHIRRKHTLSLHCDGIRKACMVIREDSTSYTNEPYVNEHIFSIFSFDAHIQYAVTRQWTRFSESRSWLLTDRFTSPNTRVWHQYYSVVMDVVENDWIWATCVCELLQWLICDRSDSWPFKFIGEINLISLSYLVNVMNELLFWNDWLVSSHVCDLNAPEWTTKHRWNCFFTCDWVTTIHIS